MTRSRLTLTVDEAARILIVRYHGTLEGEQINDSMIDHLSRLEAPWDFDSIIDMRRYDGVVLAEDIQQLGMRWALLAQGRDRGRFTAVISEDPLVRARLSTTQAAFPFRNLAYFDYFDDGLDWIKAQRGDASQAVA